MISDTHDLLRPEVVEELAGVDLILHGGDVCCPEILEELRQIAPVIGVRGNCDYGDWAEVLPVETTVEICGWNLQMIHDRSDLGPDRRGDVVIFGHSHRPTFERDGDGTLFLNPGSAGRRRFELPVALARVRLFAEYLDVEQIEWPDL